MSICIYMFYVHKKNNKIPVFFSFLFLFQIIMKNNGDFQCRLLKTIQFSIRNHSKSCCSKFFVELIIIEYTSHTHTY